MVDANKEFIKAAKSGNVEKLQVLLKANPSAIHARDSDGSTALHCATWKGHQAVVTFLLNAGADVNSHNNNDHWGTTPLHAAAHANQATIAQVLIDNGADVNARDKEGRTPLDHTNFHKAKAAAKVLQSNGAT
ncbi:MAG TPA: ankyrin repeat domain-containing protein [Blastocatellia bacterium]|nr:ankyrin repeat domain-containing protein [Blastocatellia bacterium]